MTLPKLPLRQFLPALLVLSLALSTYFFWDNSQKQSAILFLASARESAEKELQALKNEDQVKKNETLQKEIGDIQKTYGLAVSTYEKILDLGKSPKTDTLNADFAKVLRFLSEKNFASASSTLNAINQTIEREKTVAISTFKIPDNIVVNNQPPPSGYRRQSVQTDAGSFLVDIITADLNSTRVIVDTASESDCGNDCPVLPLADYVSRNGAFAGINGSFFCPATYPSCAGKTNSFDTLLMNKNKHYFNSNNNVYSTVPAVIFSGNGARFVGRSLEWGRDTGVDAVLANYPMLVSGGQSNFGGNGDPKLDSRGTRTFIGTTNSTVYIGLVSNATSAEAAKVLQTLGIQNALGLDQGGSTALWYGSYKMGPGRNIPNAILFIKK